MRPAVRRTTRHARSITKEPAIYISFPYHDGPRPRDFHARVTRKERARPVLALHRRRLRKRYATLAAAIALPAVASATDWRAGVPTTTEVSRPTRASIAHAGAVPAYLNDAVYTPPAFDDQIHSDAGDEPGSFADEAMQGSPIARAFLSGGSPLDRARAEQCLTMAVYYEAAGESDDGQRAVAQVVLNRVAHPSFPNTVCGVVFEGSERGTGCQFTFTCDGSLARKPAAYWWNRARRVAHDALDGAVYAPVGLATHYHTIDVHPYWDDSLAHVITIGAHTFYRWRGLAGQQASFQAAYLGGEPLAAPRPRVLAPMPSGNDDPVALARAFEAAQPSTTVHQMRSALPATSAATAAAPVYADAVQARGGDALFRGGSLPTGGSLSPQLQRSGDWLARPAPADRP